ncbi:MAG: histidine kinase [Verrucomicrobiaceae bacterium]|nr:histidine kinase [Verrucomicrobiaceae bacterium]
MKDAQKAADSTPPFAGRGYRLMQAGFWALFVLTVTVTVLSGPPSISFDEMPQESEGAIKKAFASLQPVMWMHNAVMTICGILATHLLHVLTLRRRWDLSPLRRLLPVVMVACMMLALTISLLIHSITAFSAGPGFGLRIVGTGLLMEVFSTSIITFFLLGMWAALYYACHAFTRLHQMEITTLRSDSAIKEARLQTIATQLNPHFLFNSLNTVRALIEESPKQARDAVTQLSLVLRASLSSSDQKLIPLRDELTAVNALLDLELIRYGDRLHVQRTVGEGCERALVPPLLLVTLVENAVKHGVAAKLGPGHLRYTAQLENGSLYLRVENSGTLTADWQQKGGIGLAHTQERLALLFGEKATMTIQQTANGVEATVILPQNP